MTEPNDITTPEELEFSYVPEDIEYVKEPGRPGHHVDPVTGKRTYPSWHKRAQREIFRPEDLEMRSREPNRDDVRLCRRVQSGLGEIPDDGVDTKQVVNKIKEIEGITQREAYQVLYNSLWCTGLVQREGVRNRQSGRPMRQKWFFVE